MSKGKKEVGFRWWGDWTVVWVLGGIGLTYLVFVPLKEHPLHWLFSLFGGVVGYGIGLFSNNGLPQIVRFVRHSLRRMTLKPGGETPRF